MGVDFRRRILFFFFLKTNINRKRYEKIGTTIGMIDVRGFLHHRTDRFTWSELKKKKRKRRTIGINYDRQTSYPTERALKSRRK